MIEQFHFLRPQWLLLLPLLFWLLWHLRRQHFANSNWRDVIDSRLLPHVLSGGEQRRRRWPLRVVALIAVLGILALAGPTWERVQKPVFRDQASLVILLDLSLSMETADIKPSRLARARLKIADVLNLRKQGQTALVVYAADAFSVTPLTDDSETILAMLPSLDTSLMPAQGSRAGPAFELAFELLHNSGVPRGDLLLVSDGLDEREAAEVVSLLEQNPAHRLSVLAIGSREGGPIPRRGGGFVLDKDGAIVIARLGESDLREVAQLGGGVYASISSDDLDINTLSYLFDSSLDSGEAGTSDRSADLWRELGPWLLLLALPLAALAFRRGLIWLLPLWILVLPPDAQAQGWDSWWRNPDQRAAELFQQGQPAAAAELFGNRDWRASAQYRAGDYAAALEYWRPLIDEEAQYNSGNALAAMGRYGEAIEAYDEVLRQDPAHADARYNKEQIEQWMQQQEKQGQQQSNGGQSGEEQSNKKSQPGQDGSSAQQQEQQSAQQSEGDDNETSPRQGEKASTQRQQAGETEAETGDAETRAGETGQEPNEGETLADLDQQMSRQAAEQWLRKIPDDPGGLLRRKFSEQYRNRGRKEVEGQPW